MINLDKSVKNINFVVALFFNGKIFIARFDERIGAGLYTDGKEIIIP